jgi:hypothetical protein
MAGTGRDLHIDVALSNVALNYRPQGMIADMVAPIVGVPKQSNLYPIWSQADAFRVEADQRGPGTEARIVHRNVSSGNYFAKNYALKADLTLEDMENADDAFLQGMREGKVNFILDKLMLGWEKRVGLACTSGSNVYSYSGPASAWTDLRDGYSDPISNIITKQNMIQDVSGYRPNAIVMGGQAWRYFRRHQNVIRAVYGDMAGGMSGRQLNIANAKALLEVDYFAVGDAYYNTAEEGQSASLASIWKDYTLIYYRPPAASVDVPSFMYTFRWQKPGIPQMQVERHPWDPKTKKEEIEAGYYQDEKITSSALAALIITCNSAQ